MIGSTWISWLKFVGLHPRPLGLLALLSLALSVRAAQARSPGEAEADELFALPRVLTLQLEMAPQAVASLRSAPRQKVSARLKESGALVGDVEIRIKGSIGSFRPFDDKPGWTITLPKDGRRFHGLRKFHLNNSVQDPSFVSELVGMELFRKAGVPTPRVSHALVEVNGRKLGLYVLMESYDRELFEAHLGDGRGNLYGQSAGADVDQPLERTEGSGENTRADLQALVAAAREPDEARRWTALRRTLDTDRFLSFMAMEVLLSHWDGYTFGVHNYRVYGDRTKGRMVFLPHDLDQLMGDANVPFIPPAAGLVAQAILSTKPARELYVARCGTLFTNLFQSGTVTTRVDQVAATILPALRAHDAGLAAEVQGQIQHFRQRFLNRQAGLAQQFLFAAAEPVSFQSGAYRPRGWQAQVRAGNAVADQTQHDGRTTLHLRVPADGATASWRHSVLLAAGKYRFTGLLKTARVVPRPDNPRMGATLRISREPRNTGLTGDSGWQKVQVEFSVAEPKRVVLLVCDLHCQSGEAWFDESSLTLERVE